EPRGGGGGGEGTGVGCANGRAKVGEGADSVGEGYESADGRGKCVVHHFGGCGARPDICADREREPGLFRRDSQRRQQVGEFGGGAKGVDGRASVGIPGGASRFVGLRRGFAADVVRMERQDSRDRDYDENGTRVCAGPKEWKATVSGDGTSSAEERYSRRDGLANAALGHLDGAGRVEGG